MSTLDARKNFSIAAVSTGYALGDTLIALATGKGALFPQPSTDGAFNVVWWNFTDYPSPADDPNVEIVRVTARTTDTLTVTRAQEGTSATAKNTSGKTYRMILAPTAKMITDIETALDGKQASLGYTPENVANKGIANGYVPLPIILAHRLAAKMDGVRMDETLPYLRPDGKTQVSILYRNNKPASVTSLVLAVPHAEEKKLDTVKNDLYETVVVPVLNEYGLTIDIKDILVNGTGVWHIGGPASDTGLTGRKIIVDSYGGYARVGGGAFSGKDPTKVDRSGAYAARFLAKNIVAKGLAEKVEIELAYCIGQKYPVAVEIDTFDTQTVSMDQIKSFAESLLDISVSGILEGLSLRRLLYLKTAAYGHFGREEFPWEKIVK
jgi:S-adenosylmethionine synthetase